MPRHDYKRKRIGLDTYTVVNDSVPDHGADTDPDDIPLGQSMMCAFRRGDVVHVLHQRALRALIIESQYGKHAKDITHAPDAVSMWGFRALSDARIRDTLTDLLTPETLTAAALRACKTKSGDVYDMRAMEWLHAHGGDTVASKSIIDDVARTGDLEVVRWLVDRRRDGATCNAIDNAAAGGHDALIQFLYDNNVSYGANAIDIAIGNGHLSTAKLLHEDHRLIVTVPGLHAMVRGGHVHVLDWLLSNRVISGLQDSHLYVTAFRHAQLGMLKALKEHGLEPPRRLSLCNALDDRGRHRSLRPVLESTEWTEPTAAYRALCPEAKLHIDSPDDCVKTRMVRCMMWASENLGGVIEPACADVAASIGFIEALGCMHESYNVHASVRATRSVIENNNAPLLGWLHENQGAVVQPAHITLAVESGSVDVLRFVLSKIAVRPHDLMFTPQLQRGVADSPWSMHCMEILMERWNDDTLLDYSNVAIGASTAGDSELFVSALHTLVDTRSVVSRDTMVVLWSNALSACEDGSMVACLLRNHARLLPSMSIEELYTVLSEERVFFDVVDEESVWGVHWLASTVPQYISPELLESINGIGDVDMMRDALEAALVQPWATGADKDSSAETNQVAEETVAFMRNLMDGAVALGAPDVSIYIYERMRRFMKGSI